MTEQRDTLMDHVGRYLARQLQQPSPGFEPYTHANVAALRRVLQPGDVLLIEGVARVSIAIKYLTQSTWSHAALFVGDALGQRNPDGEAVNLIEANLGEGVVAVPLSKYEHFNTRICRPNRLTGAECAKVVDFMVGSLGKRYDMKNITDLMRYFMPTPPIPVRWRRRMLSLGAGDPTRAICSSLIAEAFHEIRYPILPMISREFRADTRARDQRREILHIRHHSLYAPRDFDLSPYFHIVKPTLAVGFDHRVLVWADQAARVATPLPKAN